MRRNSSHGSSPHTRGALIDDLEGEDLLEDHPRIRGEHLPRVSQSPTLRGSSPHTRGARPVQPRPRGRTRIIPAYAGSTRSRRRLRHRRQDHPRIRGEHNGLVVFSLDPHGSSPHTRGAPPSTGASGTRNRIIPAYAGSTQGGASWIVRRRDHPRIRGEHAGDPLPDGRPWGSSPHTRGAHRRAKRQRAR